MDIITHPLIYYSRGLSRGLFLFDYFVISRGSWGQETIIVMDLGEEEERYLPGRLGLGVEPNCCVVPGKGILYTTSRLSLEGGQEVVLDGQCRFESVDGTVLEGEFENGVSKGVAVYIGRYPRGWIQGEWRDGAIQGVAEIYDKEGNLEYQGETQRGLRHGQGTEYLAGDVFSGTWVNNSKEGQFKQNLRNFSTTAVGNYKQGKKVGTWIFQNASQNTTITYQQDKLAAPAPTPAPFLNHPYNNSLTQSDYERLSNHNEMLSHQLVSAWSYYLQTCLSLKCRNNVLLFPTETIKDLKGIDHTECRYERVRHLTKHFQGKFNICWVLEDSEKKLLFPIIRGSHFYLVVIRVIKEQGDYRFKGEVYDSLGGSAGNGECVREYLLLEIQDKCEERIREYFKEKVTGMKFEVVECPRQSDVISCGAFVSLFMERFVQEEEIEKEVGKKKIQKYRKRMRELLEKESVELEDVFKDSSSKAKIVFGTESTPPPVSDGGREGEAVTEFDRRGEFVESGLKGESQKIENIEQVGSQQPFIAQTEQRQQSQQQSVEQPPNLPNSVQAAQQITQPPTQLQQQQQSSQPIEVPSPSQPILNQPPIPIRPDSNNPAQSQNPIQQAHQEQNLEDSHLKSQSQPVEEQKEQGVHQQDNILYFGAKWLKWIHLAIFIFVFCLHSNEILTNINWVSVSKQGEGNQSLDPKSHLAKNHTDSLESGKGPRLNEKISNPKTISKESGKKKTKEVSKGKEAKPKVTPTPTPTKPKPKPKGKGKVAPSASSPQPSKTKPK